MCVYERHARLMPAGTPWPAGVVRQSLRRIPDCPDRGSPARLLCPLGSGPLLPYDDAESRAPSRAACQRRRVDVAIGIIGRPDIWFSVEPTTGLDPEGRRVSGPSA